MGLKMITVRVCEEQHKRYKLAACKSGKSMNQFVVTAIEQAIHFMEEGQPDDRVVEQESSVGELVDGGGKV